MIHLFILLLCYVSIEHDVKQFYLWLRCLYLQKQMIRFQSATRLLVESKIAKIAFVINTIVYSLRKPTISWSSVVNHIS